MDVFKLAKDLREHSLVHPVDDPGCNFCFYLSAVWVKENLGADFFMRVCEEVKKDEMRAAARLN